MKHEIKKMQKLMTTISTLRSALQLLIREAPGVQRVVLILGGSPLRPQKAYELFFTHSVDVLRFEGDFSKNKATEALSKKVSIFLPLSSCYSEHFLSAIRGDTNVNLFILFWLYYRLSEH